MKTPVLLRSAWAAQRSDAREVFKASQTDADNSYPARTFSFFVAVDFLLRRIEERLGKTTIVSVITSPVMLFQTSKPQFSLTAVIPSISLPPFVAIHQSRL